jgi:DNA-binding SARP family transcriptional activator
MSDGLMTHHPGSVEPEPEPEPKPEPEPEPEPGPEASCGVLGPLLITLDGRALRLHADKQRALLAALALRGEGMVSYDRLVDCVWDQAPPRSSRATLHSYVHRLRLAFGSEGRRFIRSVPGGYRLDTRTVRLDLLRFRELTGAAALRAQSGDVAGEAGCLRDALALWRGPALADVPSETLHGEEVPPLVEERLGAQERRVDAEPRLGRGRGVIAELRELTAEHPLRERFWAQLMIALHVAGRTAESLAVYRLARHRLAEEAGLEPGEQLVRLEAAIRYGQPGRDMVRDVIGPALVEPATIVSSGLTARSKIPRQLPSGSNALVGRDGEVRMLLETLRRGSGTAFSSTLVPVALIAGMAGTGKTALVVHVANLLAEEFPDGQLYVDLRSGGTGRLDPGQALSRLLRGLGVGEERLPDDLYERADLYRDVVGDRLILVVLDNAVDEAQVRPLLPGRSGCAVLVTSRARLGGLGAGRLLELDVLARQQAVELLRQVLGSERVASERKAADELVRLCGGLPLALRIAAARLLTKPHWTLARMAAQLRDESRRLDELVHGELDVRGRFALSYSELDEVAKTVLRRVGMLGASGFRLASAATITGMNEADAEAALERLVDAKLVDARLAGPAGPVDPGTPVEVRYRLADLVRLFAIEQDQGKETDEDALETSDQCNCGALIVPG